MEVARAIHPDANSFFCMVLLLAMIAVLHLDTVTVNAASCIGPIEDSGNAAT
jgi:hypothetical protein